MRADEKNIRADGYVKHPNSIAIHKNEINIREDGNITLANEY